MAINTDSFTYSNGILETVSGGNWVQLRTGVDWGHLSILSNQVSYAGAGVEASYTYNATYASENIYSQMLLSGWAATCDVAVGINLAQLGADIVAGYCAEAWLVLTVETLDVYKSEAEYAWTKMGSSESSTDITSSGVLKIAHNAGDDIVLYYDGVEKTNPGGVDSSYSAAVAGVISWNLGFDNWEGGDIVSAVLFLNARNTLDGNCNLME